MFSPSSTWKKDIQMHNKTILLFYWCQQHCLSPSALLYCSNAAQCKFEICSSKYFKTILIDPWTCAWILNPSEAQEPAWGGSGGPCPKWSLPGPLSYWPGPDSVTWNSLRVSSASASELVEGQSGKALDPRFLQSPLRRRWVELCKSCKSRKWHNYANYEYTLYYRHNKHKYAIQA